MEKNLQLSAQDPEENTMFQLSPFHQSLTDASAVRDFERLKRLLKLKHNADLSVAELIIGNGDNSQNLHSYTSLYLTTNCLEDADIRVMHSFFKSLRHSTSANSI